MTRMMGWKGSTDIPAQVRSTLAYHASLTSAGRESDMAANHERFERIRDANNGDAKRAGTIMEVDGMIEAANYRAVVALDLQERRRVELHHDPEGYAERQVSKPPGMDEIARKRLAARRAGYASRGRYGGKGGKLRRTRAQKDRRNEQDRAARLAKNTNGEGWMP